ncbi:MAG: TRAP transporter substrate-binding protein [Marinomonas foliarum]|uniref:Tripartite ATP-independent transporter DctP family solute receptor n=1 Tax=Marinomonas foliarum TaxID=491950 RepID=A0A369ACP8_9GAMM|nr:TRAP transporter substrate-binding protein [Marinomonas foliarum]RCX05867.1 tripartite ATP-independent transporter DctP family solute receptor [Marinomonas foliarum]
MKNIIHAALISAGAITLSIQPLMAEARDFRLGLITPANHIWTQSAQAFGDALKQETNGEHSVTVFPSSQLGNEAQMVQQLQTGALDMAFLSIAEVSNRVPDFGALYAPYLVDNIDQAAALLQSETATKMLDQLPGSLGVVGIGYGMAGLRQVLSRDPIDNASDLKGKKIRITPFEPIRDFYNAIGAAPTPLPLPAVYDALANGQVDAIDMDFDSILILKFYEQANNLMISNHMMFPMVGVVSGRVWKTLSNEDKALIRSNMKDQLDGIIGRFQDQEKYQEKEMRNLDITITEGNADDFSDAIKVWEETWSRKSKMLPELRAAAAKIKNM